MATLFNGCCKPILRHNQELRMKSIRIFCSDYQSDSDSKCVSCSTDWSDTFTKSWDEIYTIGWQLEKVMWSRVSECLVFLQCEYYEVRQLRKFKLLNTIYIKNLITLKCFLEKTCGGNDINE